AAPASLLDDGTVLLVGGDETGRSTELFDAAAGQFSVSAPLSSTRVGAAAARLFDGSVLAVGGHDENGALATAEIYDPVSRTFAGMAATLTAPRSNASATVLD